MGTNSRFLNADELKQVYGFMYSDASDLLEEGTLTKEEKDVMSCKILLGQPVAMPDGAAGRDAQVGRDRTGEACTLRAPLRSADFSVCLNCRRVKMKKILDIARI